MQQRRRWGKKLVLLGFALMIGSALLAVWIHERDITWLTISLLLVGFVLIALFFGRGKYRYSKWGDYLMRGGLALLGLSWLMEGVAWLLEVSGFTVTLPPVLVYVLRGGCFVCFISGAFIQGFQNTE